MRQKARKHWFAMPATHRGSGRRQQVVVAAADSSVGSGARVWGNLDSGCAGARRQPANHTAIDQWLRCGRLGNGTLHSRKCIYRYRRTRM
ncbi:hypothetical protein AVEN_51547-1 [Araneus ventricosus]|uniref:Uncharacterized protein n=1 Tax=Araneus ventricosus TaxID=182803 RepID=A0A4Y2QA86_ARAVE|nr:hypothetical protein AVEN_138060-1 [Araneus ventricosus]GBN59252.1 hypothetical protein AVEN_51547-1 [Araneus ventricosus]